MGIIKRQGIKNNIILYVGALIGFFNVLIVQPNMLSPDEVGLVRILYGVSILFASLYPFGLSAFTLKYFPHVKDFKNGHHGFIGFLVIATTVLFLIGSLLFYYFRPFLISKYADSKLFIEQFNFVFPMSYFLGLFIVLSSYSTALFKTTVPSFLNEIVLRLIIIVLISLYYVHIIDFQLLIWFYSFSYLLLAVILIVYIKKTDVLIFRPSFEVFKHIPKDILKFSLLTGFAGLASIVFKQVDAVFIGAYLGLANVAVYTIAMTICSMIDVPANALGKIAIPKFSEGFKNNDKNFLKELYHKSNRVSLFCGSFLFLLIFVNAHEILSFLPSKYHQGEQIMKVIAFGALINNAAGLNSNFLLYSERYALGAVAFIILGLLSSIANIFLIPALGMMGAALSTVLALITMNVVVSFYIKKYFDIYPFEGIDWLILSMTLLIAVVTFLIPSIDNTFLSIFIKSAPICVIFGVILHKARLLGDLSSFPWIGKFYKN